jgi:nicotinamidase-related amidase
VAIHPSIKYFLFEPTPKNVKNLRGTAGLNSYYFCMVKQLILGIDLQEGFLSDEVRGKNYVDRVEKYLGQQNKEEVLLTKFINQPNSNFVKLSKYDSLMPDDPDTKLIGNLEAQDYAVLKKCAYSAWQPQLIERIEEQGITEIVMFGLDTHACVFKTALDVFEAGLRPIVLKDLCYSSTGQTHHDMGMELLKELIGYDQVQ